MKTGRTLQELDVEVKRQAQVTVRRDLLVMPSAVTMATYAGGKSVMGLADDGDYGMNEVGHQQLGEYLGVPAQFYGTLRREHPDVLDYTVNTLLQRRPQNERRMARTLDGQVRAWLSDKYRPLDNFDLVDAALPALFQANALVLSCEVTDKRLYIKAVDKRIQRDIPTGKSLGQGHTFFDTLSPAIILTNSEVGLGALAIEAGIWTHLCTNLAVAKSRSMRKYHTGQRHELGDDVYALLSDTTRKVTDAAFWMQIGDVVKAALDQARFDALVNEVKQLTTVKIQGDPVVVIERTAKKFSITGDEREAMLRHLIEGGDLTGYGLFNAVTRTAEDAHDYDRASEIERIGGQIIDLSAGDWKDLGVAA